MIEHLAHGVNSWGQQRGADRAATIFNALHGVQPAAKEIVYDKAATDKLIAELNQRALVAEAVAEGRLQQALAFKAALETANSKHPLLQPSGFKFKDGSSKSGAHMVFERAFDGFLSKVGGFLGANPKAYRKD